MKLTELEPKFLRRETDRSWYEIDDLSKADGVMFLCPKCFRANNGRVGTHVVICWSPKVPQTTSPGPGRWNLVGTGYVDLSLVAGSSSVQITSGCRWHGFVRNGEVTEA